MEVAYTEVGNAGSFESLSMLINGQSSTCSQTYNGPTAGEFLEFANTIYQFTQGAPQTGANEQTQAQIDNIWLNDLIDTAIDQIDDALDEPWLDKTPCSVELSGQRRSLQQTGGNTNYSVVIKPNTPIRVVLGASGRLEGGGLRKWETNASIYSSFRLAGIMQGGGSPDPNNDCCSPYTASWILSTIADDVPGGASESVYQNATQGFFNLRGLSTNVWSETGSKFNYNGFNCPSPVNVEIVKPLTGDFDDNFELKGGSAGIDLEVLLDQDLSQTVKFSLFNTAGQLIAGVSSSRQTSSVRVQTAGLPSGVYFLTSRTDDGQVFTKKIFLWN